MGRMPDSPSYAVWEGCAIDHRRAGFGWLQRLKKHHISHHFVEDYSELRYGVSTRLWDMVFNTEEAHNPRRKPPEVREHKM